MSLNLALHGYGSGRSDILALGFGSEEQQQALEPVRIYTGTLGGGGVGGWTGERVGWWPVGKKPLDGELLSPEESKRIRREMEGEPDEVLFTVTRVTLEDTVYTFTDGGGDGPPLLTGHVRDDNPDDEYDSPYIGERVERVALSAPTAPLDWKELAWAALGSFVVSAVAARIHPGVALAATGVAAIAARKHPLILAGVLLGGPLGLATLPQTTKPRKVFPRVTPAQRKRLRRVRIQRLRVYGRRKVR